FFQAEDGIRDWSVTGVQTCALPIYAEHSTPIGCDHSAPGLDDTGHIGFGIARFTASLETVREQILPGLFLKPFSQGVLSQFIDGLAPGPRLRLQFGQQFVRYANIVLGCHVARFFQRTVTPARAGGMPPPTGHRVLKNRIDRYSLY